MTRSDRGAAESAEGGGPASVAGGAEGRAARRIDRGRFVLVAAVLAAVFWFLPDLRRAYVRAVVTHDAPPGEAPPLPGGGREPSVPPAPAVRVVLIDGVGHAEARDMAAWTRLCTSGLDLVVDVGFPTVSLPVQVALWSGRTQQQTGILFRSGRALVPPLGAGGIPGQVPDSVAVAESQPYIVQSLGFARVLPPSPDGKTLPAGWADHWLDEASAAVGSPARLAFVHILRVDSAGHKHGRGSAAWQRAIADADRILGELVASGTRVHPDALWLVLSDHGHLAGGGHGGEEPAIRRVRACFAGPGISTGRGGPIALVDVSRALADAAGVHLAADAPGRPLAAALAHPLGDELLPRVPAGRIALAVLVLLTGAAATAWAMGGLGFGPWWWPLAMLLLIVVEGVPTLSTPMIYKPEGRDMYLAFSPALALLVPWAVLALGRRGPVRGAVALLALPVAGFFAALVASGGVAVITGAEVAPIVPRWTAWTSALGVMAATGAGVVALAALATAVLPEFGRGRPRAAPRSEP